MALFKDSKVTEERYEKIMEAFTKPVENLKTLVKDAVAEETRIWEEENRLAIEKQSVVAVKEKTQGQLAKFKEFLGIE